MWNVLGVALVWQSKDDRLREKNDDGIDRGACFNRGDLGGRDLRLHLREQERTIGVSPLSSHPLAGEGGFCSSSFRLADYDHLLQTRCLRLAVGPLKVQRWTAPHPRPVQRGCRVVTPGGRNNCGPKPRGRLWGRLGTTHAVTAPSRSWKESFKENHGRRVGRVLRRPGDWGTGTIGCRWRGAV